MTRRSWLPLAVVAAVTVVALLFGAWFVGRGEEPTAGGWSSVDVAGVRAAPRVGEPAPEGLPVGDGQPTWLVFMATWCQECRVEAPDVEAASRRGDVRVVGVYVGETEETVTGYAERTALTFESVPDTDGAISASYGVRAIPAHYFVDGEGVVREVAFGALSAPLIEDKLDALIG